MAPGRLVLVLGLLFHTCKMENNQVHVTISGDEVKDETLPTVLNVTVKIKSNDTVQLRLKRAPHLESDIPVYSLTTDNIGKSVHRRENLNLRKTVGYFHDPTHNALVQVTRTNDSGEGTYRLRGNFNYAGTRYLLQNEKSEEMIASSTSQAQFSPQSSQPLNESSWSSLQKLVGDETLHSLQTLPLYQSQSSNESLLPLETQERSSIDEQVYSLMDHRHLPFNKLDYKEMPPLTDADDSLLNIKTPTNDAKLASSKMIKMVPRYRRSSKTTYYIDVVAVIDYKTFHRFRTEGLTFDEALADAIKHYTLLFFEVDLIYQAILSPDFRIKIQLVKILVAEEESDLGFLKALSVKDTPKDYVDSSKLLLEIRNFVKTDGRSIVGPHDHVMLFTDYDLANSVGGRVDKNFIGYAYVAAMCYPEGRSVSAIEDDGFSSMLAVAHELGHSLGAHHDGEGNSCSWKESFLMGKDHLHVNEGNQHNPWRLSNCSLNYITEYTNYLLGTARGQECLLKGLTSDSRILELEGALPGRLYSLEEQCQMIEGVGSRLCWSQKMMENASSICTHMYCENMKKRNWCNVRFAYSGTTCGDGKMCLLGQCVSHPDAPRVSEICVFGDPPGIVYNGQTCPQLARSQSTACHSENLRRICCSSCMAVLQPIPVQDVTRSSSSEIEISPARNVLWVADSPPSRDDSKDATQSPDVASEKNRERNRGNNSETNSEAPECRDLNTVLNGVSCFSAVRLYPQICYNTIVKHNCCQSCMDQRRAQPGCEYGDRLPDVCKTVRSCSALHFLFCCDTCSRKRG